MSTLKNMAIPIPSFSQTGEGINRRVLKQLNWRGIKTLSLYRPSSAGGTILNATQRSLTYVFYTRASMLKC